MSALRKLKRKKEKPFKDKVNKAQAAKDKQEHVSQFAIVKGANILRKIKDARVGILCMCYIYLMYYEFHVPVEELRQLPVYLEDLQWYLHHSYNEKGELQNIPMFKLIEICQQIEREKKYCPIVRTPYDKKDEILRDIVMNLVHLEIQLLWITVDKFGQGKVRFGKVRLARLQNRLQEMEETMTYEEQLKLREKLKTELNFTFDECAEEDFSPWVWDKSKGLLKEGQQ